MPIDPVTGSNRNGERYEPKKGYNIDYMHRAPAILPNYGKKKQISTPRSSLTRVLLYENANQKQVLRSRLSHIKTEQKKLVHFLEMRKNSFLIQRVKRIRELKEESEKEKKTLFPAIETNQRINGEESPPQNSDEPSENDESESQSPLAVIIQHIKLPEIDPDRERRHIVFKLKDNYGDTKIYHTVDDGILSDVVPLHAFYPNTIQDPRFKELENVLYPVKFI